MFFNNSRSNRRRMNLLGFGYTPFDDIGDGKEEDIDFLFFDHEDMLITEDEEVTEPDNPQVNLTVGSLDLGSSEILGYLSATAGIEVGQSTPAFLMEAEIIGIYYSYSEIGYQFKITFNDPLDNININNITSVIIDGVVYDTSEANVLISSYNSINWVFANDPFTWEAGDSVIVEFVFT